MEDLVHDALQTLLVDLLTQAPASPGGTYLFDVTAELEVDDGGITETLNVAGRGRLAGSPYEAMVGRQAGDGVCAAVLITPTSFGGAAAFTAHLVDVFGEELAAVRSGDDVQVLPVSASPLRAGRLNDALRSYLHPPMESAGGVTDPRPRQLLCRLWLLLIDEMCSSDDCRAPDVNALVTCAAGLLVDAGVLDDDEAESEAAFDALEDAAAQVGWPQLRRLFLTLAEGEPGGATEQELRWWSDDVLSGRIGQALPPRAFLQARSGAQLSWAAEVVRDRIVDMLEGR